MTSEALDTIIDQIKDRADVYSAKIWNDRRVYVNLTGADSSFAGDRNIKVYYDIKSGWVIDGMKGTMSTLCAHSLASFREEVIAA